jgi:hypothetical protein
MNLFTHSLFAYLAPETVLPFTSVIAAVAGVVMIFGRNAAGFVVARCRRLRRIGNRAGGIPEPHLRTGTRAKEQSPSASR